MDGEASKKDLYEAAKAREVARYRELVEEDPYLVDVASFAYSRNLLHIATMHGQADIVEEVLKMSPQLARELDSQKSSTLHIAAAKGYVEIVVMLLRIAPEMRWWRDGQDMNPVHVAAMNGHVEVLEELLRLDCFPAMERLHGGQTVLHLCVKHGQFRMLKVLVEKLGNLVNATDGDGETIIDLAERCNRSEMIKLKQRHMLQRFKELTELTDMTMVVVILIATMAFQACVSPPGGVWQDDTSSHRAGEAVMASTHPKIYKHFLGANTTAFLSSLLTIYLISTRRPTKSIYFHLISVFAKWVSLASITVSYGAAVVVLTPNAGIKSLQSVIITAVVSLGIIIILPAVYQVTWDLYQSFKSVLALIIRRSATKDVVVL